MQRKQLQFLLGIAFNSNQVPGNYLSALLIRKSTPSFAPRDSYSIDREKVLRIWIFNTHHILFYQAVLRNTTAA